MGMKHEHIMKRGKRLTRQQWRGGGDAAWHMHRLSGIELQRQGKGRGSKNRTGRVRRRGKRGQRNRTNGRRADGWDTENRDKTRSLAHGGVSSCWELCKIACATDV